VQDGAAAAAACVTVNVWPATAKVPERAGPELAATLKAAEPFPVPLPPEVTVTHAAPLLAVHAQPLAVDTATVTVPPVAATAVLDGPT
jgi:hypothetical protein